MKQCNISVRPDYPQRVEKCRLCKGAVSFGPYCPTLETKPNLAQQIALRRNSRVEIYPFRYCWKAAFFNITLFQ
jgi:hypothetical protein